LTFLIADIRGYTRFTQERGDEAAAKLTDRFAQVMRDLVETFDGTVFELRGDEALCVFRSPRQSLRAAVALQRRFVEETVATPGHPMTVGIGVDAGEAVHGANGYRGGALNLAARLCGQARAGQILVSPEVAHLARAIEGLQYVALDGVELKGLAEPIRPVRVVPEGDDPAHQMAAFLAMATKAEAAPPPGAGESVGPSRRPNDLRDSPGKGAPVAAAELVGREAELSAVRDLLTSPSTRLVTITGAPGVGKTRLAQAIAADLADDFTDGVAWVDLAPLREPRQIIGELARAVGVGERAPEIAVDALAEALVAQELLLVLDNFEHLLDGVPHISELLAASPHLRILATSRERLHLTMEREYPLPPLPMPFGPEPTDLDRLRDNPSIALLLARAPAVQLTARTSQALADICVRLDGLPLAIELAAARLRVFTPSELAFRLERSAGLLASAARDVPGRHRDILSAIAWSHDLLPENERIVFRRASVFVGSWTLTDAIAITPAMNEYDVVAAVESLLDKSLVRRSDVTVGDGQEARFSFLFSVREYAAARLEESGEIEDARRCHMLHFADVAIEWEQTVGTPDEALTFPWTEYARLDLRAALEFGRDQGDAAATLRLATALGWYWYTRGSLGDVAGVQEVVANAIEGQSVDDDLRAAGLLARGVVSVGLGDNDAAERDLTRAAEMCERVGDIRRLAIAEAFLGHALRGRGEYERAGESYTASRNLWVGLGSRRGIAWSAHDLGLLAYETGDYPAAETYLREALDGFRELQYDWAVAVSACGLGTVLIAERQPDEGAQLLGEALVIHDSVADRRGVAQCLESLASLAVVRGDPATAGRLRGAAETWRTAAAARPSRAEEERLAELDESVRLALGRGPADAERHAGRILHPVASIALAAAFAASASASATGESQHDGDELTARQRDVAALIAAGHTNRQIGRALGISEKTAEVHVRNIMERLNTPSRAGVAAWAASRGITAPAS